MKKIKDMFPSFIIPDLLQDLYKKIQRKKVVVGVYGLGYVGLPLALRFSEVGIKVIGFDIDVMKVDKINSGVSYINHIESLLIQRAQRQGFFATTDYSYTNNLDAIIICVPTPLNSCREPDLSYILDTLDAACPYMHSGQLVSLESTTWPGTTDELLVPRLELYGWQPGHNCAVVFSPEREDPGNSQFNTKNIPKVIGGITPSCLQLGTILYQHAITTMVPVSNTRVAEMTKLLENIQRSVNIGLVNEMKIVADKMGINIHDVIDAAATKPFGFMPYRPGPGVGGHCIPIDPLYLTWKAHEYGIKTRLIELAGEINCFMPEWVVSKIINALDDNGKVLEKSSILILGLSYKKNIDDLRDSPSVSITKMLKSKGAKVDYSDPYIPFFNYDSHGERLCMNSVVLTEKNVKEYDCVLLATDHDDFDYSLLQAHATLLVDTRGRLPYGSRVVIA